MNKLVVLQPSYLPWLGYLSQMNWADAFVIYEDVQFSKEAWANRNRIKSSQEILWLTVPIITKNRENQLIREAQIDGSDNWYKKHLKAIQQNYSKAEFFKDYFWLFEEVYSREWTYLLDLDLAFLFGLKEQLGIKTKIMLASELGVPKTGKIQRLIDICLKLGATEFLEGAAGKSYLAGEGEALFEKNGIKLVYQDYQHPTYKQLYGDFVPYLSVVDLLLNCGKDSLGILTNGVSDVS